MLLYERVKGGHVGSRRATTRASLEYHLFWNGSAAPGIDEDNEFWGVTSYWPLTQTYLTPWPLSKVLSLNPDTPHQTAIPPPPPPRVSSSTPQWQHTLRETKQRKSATPNYSALILYRRVLSRENPQRLSIQRVKWRGGGGGREETAVRESSESSHSWSYSSSPPRG